MRNSTGWQSGRSAIAAPIVTAPVGELSVRYDDTLRSWEMMTLDESRKAIVVRLAPQPSGPWGNEIPVATASEYPNLYGGFLHPDSKDRDRIFLNMMIVDHQEAVDMSQTELAQGTNPATRTSPNRSSARSKPRVARYRPCSR